MTEHKDPSAIPEVTPPEAQQSPAEEQTTSVARNSGTTLAIVAIIIALATGAGSYWYIKQQQSLNAESEAGLSDKLTLLQQQTTSGQQQLSAQLTTATQALQDARLRQDTTDKELNTLREKVTSLTGNDSNNWLIAQADYLVKLAGRKLWSDQDATTAAALLKSADSSLAEMNDPSVLNIRRALMQDISALSAINQVDYDGIILQLNQLANGVDNLRLADNEDNSNPMDQDSHELSGSLAHWRENLAKSWHDFMDNFITIRRRDNTAQPLLAPNQDIYLRENIRSGLLIAAQAVPRHQEEIYKQSLESVSTWVRAWYDVNDPATKAFLAQLDALEQQTIAMDIPDTLSSQPLLDKLVQTRVRGLLNQPAAAASQQGG
ncbi:MULTISPECIES: uroporphyrinogen-III C-methyltransferase [Tatumella]|uniref:Uroporphyrinogen-III C-methyltransferase n=1 Tax=Tatumella punctata TaxID=399969 RepID=A0ABW1VSN1_9GAMM|nr:MULTISPECIES: uroporphyrinogen-III C-methyltransferase [unclassified Tatumella]MBS0857177.1 uroporphyrinogen-III C-methyltransferase [Tatumella sp. JGM16]MBS0878544.1 uroporphyrinogen-III C-methyltransferase [Tatumella sp. JGM82]MBS0892136.1 uroporphyrinogen-III C-methyltransferase [Tatumella sp. JGM94]MBS0894010.1 uroporphyrinogen-III C-methyltransferase [Tatumella sp. JGM130]MBS0903235.1 uroporphyrinogen-III C-methyltransferase [Tatumella sp. JGM100]